MSMFSIPRFSIHTQIAKILTSNFNTLSVTEKFYDQLHRNQPNVEKALTSVNAELDVNSVNEVLRRCNRSKPQMGLRFFIWSGLQSGYRHSTFMYSKACDFFEIKKNPNVVKEVIDAYRAEGCFVSVKTFKIVLSLCRQAKLANEALWVLRQMPQFGLRADTTAYNVVIRLFVEKCDLDVAEKLMGEMGLINLYPDMITYVSMIKGFCDAGRLEDACRLVKLMKNNGCLPNSVVYSTLLDGVFRFGSMEKAFELLQEMEKDGGDCSPSVITYTSAIQAFCEKGKIDEALGILDRMIAQGCSPNRVTAHTIIKWLCAKNKLEEAREVIDKMYTTGGVSRGDCLSSLVVSLLRIKRGDQAEKIFTEMLGCGLKPDSLACSLMIKAICSEDRFLDGFCLYENIEKMECRSAMDTDVYSILLAGLLQQNYSVEAEKLANQWSKKGFNRKTTCADSI